MNIPGLQITISFDKSGAVPVVRINDTTNYGAGVANNVTGIVAITQPDGLTTSGSWTYPDVYYQGSGLVQAKKELRLANDANFQKGVYTVSYTARLAGYDDTTVTQTISIDYKRPTGVITPNMDAFTPALKVNDITDYVVTGFSLQGVVRSWTVSSNKGMDVGGNVTQFDLNHLGVYYDSLYTVGMTAVMTYLLNAVSNVTVVDRMSFSLMTHPSVPDSLNSLFQQINAYKAAMGQPGCNCEGGYSAKKINFSYAYALFTDFRQRGLCGDRTGLIELYNELKAVLAGGCSQTYTATDAAIPTYDFTAFCGRDGGSVQTPLVITQQPLSQSAASGSDVTFTVAASGTPTITYQWRKAGVNIVGATSSFLTLLGISNGDAAQYDVIVRDGLTNQIASSPATLTVTAPVAKITNYWAWTNVDPAAAFAANTDPFTYQGNNVNQVSGQPAEADYRSAPNFQWLIFKEPATEPVKTVWSNGIGNGGNIPDSVWTIPVVFGGVRYYYTGSQVTLNNSQTTVFE